MAKRDRIVKEQPHLADAELCMVSWVYTDDGDGNTEFGDITQSYCSRALLTKSEQQSLKQFLKPWYDAGMIVDVYVGPESTTANPYLTEVALIGQCLPDLDDLPVARTEVDSPTVQRLREVVKRTNRRR